MKNTKNMKSMKKVIFLDIDGVLQPGGQQDRFEHNLDELKNKLATERDKGFEKLDKYDIGAVYYDWHEQSVENVRTLCEKGNAIFVISSSWRVSKTLDMLRLLFGLHDLDKYVVDKTEEFSGLYYSRSFEIEDFLIKHPEIEYFVILDDADVTDFNTRFPEHFVCCGNIFSDKNLEEALACLESNHFLKDNPPQIALDFKSFLENDPKITSLDLTLPNTSIIRRSYGYSKIRDFYDIVFDALKQNKYIKHLGICGISKNVRERSESKQPLIEIIYPILQDNQTITSLNISDNAVVDISSLIKIIKGRKCILESLDLSRNSLNDKAVDILDDYFNEINHPFTINLKSTFSYFGSKLKKTIENKPNITVHVTSNQYESDRDPAPPNLIVEKVDSYFSFYF